MRSSFSSRIGVKIGDNLSCLFCGQIVTFVCFPLKIVTLKFPIINYDFVMSH
jgi:hypothetical protein